MERKLTTRQMQVAQLYAEGHTMKEIAKILNIAFKTVDTHLMNVRDRLNVHNKAEITAMIWRNA